MKQISKPDARLFLRGYRWLFLLLPFNPVVAYTQQQSTENPTKLDLNIKTPNAASIERITVNLVEIGLA